jgi:uncharacterized membrane protein YedE/YeeE
MDEMTLAALLGLAAGCVLGLAARLGQFCTFGAIESAYVGHDQRRMRLWGIVLGTAILSIYTLDAIDKLDVSSTIYHSLNWNPIASIVGGLLFGYGMGLAGNCGFGALARVGGGDLRSFVVVIVMAISSYFILSGPLASLRVSIFPAMPAEGAQGFAQLAENMFGLPPIVVAAVIGIALITWALSFGPLRQEPTMMFWGLLAGLTVAGAFWGTYALSIASFDEVPVQGLTFTAPLGSTLLYMMTASSGGLGFPVGSVFGVLLGSLIGSKIKGHFRWEACEDPRELGRQTLGAVMMGFGGVIALGCSVGQGVSALSTLAFSGPVTLVSITLGCVISIRHILAGYEP